MKNKISKLLLLFLFILINSNFLFSFDNTNDLNNDNNFKKAFDISIGGGSIPIHFNAMFSKETFIDVYNDYYQSKVFLLATGISIPFSYSFFINSFNAIGFIIEPTYLLFPSTSLSFMHDFIFNTGFKYKYGNHNKNTKLIFEASFLTDFELIPFYYYMGEGDDTYNFNMNFIYIYFGPKLFLGMEYHYKKFSFEFGGYIGILFDPINSYIGENNFYSYYYHQFRRYQSFVFGIQLRYNFYYFKKIK